MPEHMSYNQIQEYLKTERMKALAMVISAVKDGGDDRGEAIEWAAKGELKSLLGA